MCVIFYLCGHTGRGSSSSVTMVVGRRESTEEGGVVSIGERSEDCRI